jgi:hypothetical protein
MSLYIPVGHSCGALQSKRGSQGENKEKINKSGMQNEGNNDL